MVNLKPTRPDGPGGTFTCRPVTTLGGNDVAILAGLSAAVPAGIVTSNDRTSEAMSLAAGRAAWLAGRGGLGVTAARPQMPKHLPDGIRTTDDRSNRCCQRCNIRAIHVSAYLHYLAGIITRHLMQQKIDF